MAYDAQPEGFLAEVTQRIRETLDLGSDSSKWTDSKMYPWIVRAWYDLMTDVNGLGENAIHVGFTLNLVNGQSIYGLPSNFGRFVRIVKDWNGDGIQSEVLVPRSRNNPYGGSVEFGSNWLTLRPTPTGSETLTLEYVPDGFCTIHTGETNFGETGASSTQVPLDTDPAEGYFDRRPYAYIGQVIRFLKSEEVETFADTTYWPVQERIIVDQDNDTGIVTLNEALDPDPAAEGIGAVKYEIVPFLGRKFEEQVILRVCQKIVAIEDQSGRSGKYQRLQNLYLQGQRNIRLELANKNSRTGQGFRGDVPGSGRFGWSVGNGYYWF